MEGQTYSFQDADIRIDGRVVTGCRGFSYKTAQESENIYGLGRDPIRYTKGKRTYEGSLTLLQYEAEQLIQQAKLQGKELTDLVFDVVFTYANSDGDLTTDVAKVCRVTEYEKALGVDDLMMEVELPLAIGSIKYNVFYQ